MAPVRIRSPAPYIFPRRSLNNNDKTHGFSGPSSVLRHTPSDGASERIKSDVAAPARAPGRIFPRNPTHRSLRPQRCKGRRARLDSDREVRRLDLFDHPGRKGGGIEDRRQNTDGRIKPGALSGAAKRESPHTHEASD